MGQFEEMARHLSSEQIEQVKGGGPLDSPKLRRCREVWLREKGGAQHSTGVVVGDDGVLVHHPV